MGEHHGGGANGVGEQAPMSEHHGEDTDGVGEQALRGIVKAGAPCGELVGAQPGEADCGADPALLSVGQELIVVKEASIPGSSPLDELGVAAVDVGYGAAQVQEEVMSGVRHHEGAPEGRAP
ncbi:unnamed protein product [Ilex paraguariensis]|uniref:Uncharacterized protein n=1 Tax=Ilex paraguariensis TaxID=185542 RepID=A0ABC8TE89_9AQUA